MMEVGLNIVCTEFKKPIIKFSMNPSTITRGLRSGLGPPTHDIGLEIQHDHILGLYQFDEKDTRYTIHFKVKEMLLHKSELGSKKSQNVTDS